MTAPFEGKVAVVTGAGRGIGLAVASRLVAGGATVAMVDADADAVKESAAALRGTGAQARGFATDVASSRDVDELFEEIARDLGSLDILVNNAAITRPAMLHKMTDDQWDEVIAVNLTAAFYTTRAAARHMIPHNSGAIVNVSALSALRGAMGQINYVSAKAGIVGMTKAAAKELARYSIRVNAVTPGVVETRMSEKLLTDSRFAEQYIREIPLGRVAQPADIASSICFLASEDASYLTGQVINASGGAYM
jgi:NAD(P)-dependent dehydrogenase (short-subunit alcohol dehydrogenase family)